MGAHRRRHWLVLGRIGRPLGRLCVLVGLVLVSCRGTQTSEGTEASKNVRVEPVGRADIEDVLSYPADLKPWVEVRVYSRMPDRILSFPWKDGDEIRRGAKVATVRALGFSEGIEQVGAQTDALDAQIATQKADLKRLSQLLASGAIAEAEYERLDAQLRANEAQRRALTAGKGQLLATASDGTILSPISGVVADKTLQVGDMAQPGVPLCRIINIERLKLELRLVEVDVSKVRQGQVVELKLDAYPDRVFHGQVTTVLPYLDAQTRTNTVEVAVDNPKDEGGSSRVLKPGMFGRAELVVAKRSGVLVAPEPALLLDNRILEKQKPNETLRKAFIVEPTGQAKERIVRLGARKGSSFEVLDGLKEGERLVVRGQHGLKDGQRVQLVEATKP